MRIVAAAVVALLFACVGTANAAPVTNLYVHPFMGSGGGISGNVFEMADDFVVPAGQNWRITGVVEQGFATPGAGSYTVNFYTNAGGTPGSLACTSAATPRGTFIPAVGQIQNPEFRLASPCTLGAGTWFVAHRTALNSQFNVTTTVAGVPGLLRRVLGSGTCMTWTSIGACFSTTPEDLNFTIKGCTAGACEQILASTASCLGNDMNVNITDGDAPFNITGSGPGLPRNNAAEGLQSFTGPGIWQSLAVAEVAGDTQSQSFGLVNCGPRTATFAQSGGGTSVDEGNPAVTDSYTIVLDSTPNPAETVTVTPSSNTATGVTTSPASVAFTSSNWNQPRTITVTVVDDAVLETGAQTDTITHAIATTGGVYFGATLGSVTVTITDDDEVILKDGFEG